MPTIFSSFTIFVLLAVWSTDTQNLVEACDTDTQDYSHEMSVWFLRNKHTKNTFTTMALGQNQQVDSDEIYPHHFTERERPRDTPWIPQHSTLLQQISKYLNYDSVLCLYELDRKNTTQVSR